MTDDTNLAVSAAPVRHQDTVARVMDHLRGLIREGDLRAGDELPSEAAVCRALDVSRVAVREAYRSLSALGIIDVGNGRRPRVAPVDFGVLAQIVDHGVRTDQVAIQKVLDVRRTIEMRTVVLAATLRSPREAERIVAEADGMDTRFHDAEAVMEHDIAFHQRIAAASRNPMFEMIVASFHVVTRQTWRIGWQARPGDDDRRANVRRHQEIAAAILMQDKDRAEVLMAGHFDETTRMLLDSGIN